MTEPPAPVAALYPFTPKRITVGDGVEQAVVDEGPRDAAETFVLLHGNPTWGFLYRDFVPPLVADGHRVIVPDHVGFGASSKPADVAYYTPFQHVDNLTATLDALDARDVTLAIHDWGGPIGMGWAVRRPERVKRIVVLNTVAFPPKRARPLSRWHETFAGPRGDFLAVTMNLILHSAMRFGVHNKARMRGPVFDAYAWPMKDKVTRQAALAFVRAVPDRPDHPSVKLLQEIHAGLPGFKDTPAVVLWGDKDRVFPRSAPEKWRAALPGVRRVEHFGDANHFLQEDVADGLVEAMRRFVAEG